ncbi:MAG: RDD family protein [Erysipelotrichaceae bacterium]|nr:RDD family protein [Erysipelotrichaceae bacterium]
MKKNDNQRLSYLGRRTFAFIVDWYINGIIASGLTALLNSLIYKQDQIFHLQQVLNSPKKWLVIIGLLISSIITFVVIPSKSGQTIMQRVLKIKVVDQNNNVPAITTLIIRFFIGCLILESALYTLSSDLWVILLTKIFGYKTMINIIGYLLYGIAALSLILALKDKKETKTFHDRISKTKVIDA